MKCIIRVILLLIISFNCGYSQNLVINPGFEETDTINIKRTFENYHCLTGWDFNVYNKQSWYLGTGIKNGNFSYASKVNNGLKPKSGNIIAEIRTLAFEKKGSQSKRIHTFLSGKLNTPLNKGESYYFELWYSLDWFSNVASNNIGVLFYENSIPVENGESQKQPDLNSECIFVFSTGRMAEVKRFFCSSIECN